MRDPIPKTIAWVFSIRNSIKEVVRLGRKASGKPWAFFRSGGPGVRGQYGGQGMSVPSTHGKNSKAR